MAARTAGIDGTEELRHCHPMYWTENASVAQLEAGKMRPSLFGPAISALTSDDVI